MDEIPEMIRYTKDLIFGLEKHKERIITIPDLIKELIHLGKTFNKIEIRLNEYQALLNLTPAYLEEANICLNLLRETLTNIQTQLNLFAAHGMDSKKVVDKIWRTFNAGQVTNNFANFATQVHSHAEHLHINFLPVLNSIINESTEKQTVVQSVHSLSKHEREKIASTIMKEGNIMKIYIPAGRRKSEILNPAAANPDDPESIDLERQSSATRFLINAKPSANQAHHEASDVNDPNDLADEPIAFKRMNTFSGMLAGGQRRGSGGPSRSKSITEFLSPTKRSVATTATADQSHAPPLAQGTPDNRESFTTMPGGGWGSSDFDIHLDYYHIKWFSVLPQIWSEFPRLTLGQIKYIYLTSNFFEYYHKDIYFINPKTLEEIYQLQLYLEGTGEIPLMKEEDYQWVGQLVVQNMNLSMKQMIHLMNDRFKGRREFSFLLLLGSELFLTKVKAFERILVDAIAHYPKEEEYWPEGDITLEWTVLHVIQKKHHKVFTK